MATIIRNGKCLAVKNLGWLLRHWQDVEYLGFNLDEKANGLNDGQLVAKCGNTSYLTDFASFSVCWDFLNRPVFRGIKFSVVNSDFSKRFIFTIGDTLYSSIKNCDRLEKVRAMLA